MNRREAMLRSGLLGLGCGLLGTSDAWPFESVPVKRVLLFIKSSWYEHDVVKSSSGQPSLVERVLKKLGSDHGFVVTAKKDGRVFATRELRDYDAFIFYTSGDLNQVGEDGNPPMSVQGKQALLDCIADGKGFVGVHSATATFLTRFDPADPSSRYVNHAEDVDPYIAMLGGEFINHGPQQRACLLVKDRLFPGLQKLPTTLELTDEWFSLKHFARDMHVLLVQQTQGMQGTDYQRAPYPATWARNHGSGRVFYTSMGHREDVWANPIFLEILLAGIVWATRSMDADITPNLASAAPGFAELPLRPQN